MKYFKHEEFACRCCGQLPPSVRENIEALVHNVLDPARQKYGGPVLVNSGYRCPKHNAEVGGVPRSQHMVGEAADICAGGLTAYGLGLTEKQQREENLRLAQIIVENGRFDQLILYVDGNRSLAPRFIHVSWKRDGGNRNRILKQIRGHKGYIVVPHMEIL